MRCCMTTPRKSSSSNILRRIGPSKSKTLKTSVEQILLDGETYTFQRSLKGRGQPGVAGFYTNKEGKEFLIKEDTAATCIQEGSAEFVRKYLPEGRKEVINLAHVANMTKLDGTKAIVTIQPSVKDAKPWDTVIFGKKRIAKSPISKEKFSNSILQDHLAEISHPIKSDLAAAIYGSSMLGDESIHTGQFMAVCNQEGEIQRLVRIDLGARERFALKRLETDDIKCETSKAYTKSTHQLGKNYMDFLLENPDVNAKYLHLCMQSLDRYKDIVNENMNAFDSAINKLPSDENEKKKALLAIYEVYAKDSKDEKSVSKETSSAAIEEKIRSAIVNCASQRGALLQMDAIKKVKEIFDIFQENFNTVNAVKIVLFKEKLTLPEVKLAIDEMKKLYHDFDNKSEDAKHSYYRILSHMYAAVEFSSLENKASLLQDIEAMQLVASGVRFTNNQNNNDAYYQMIMTPSSGSFSVAAEKLQTDYLNLVQSSGNKSAINALAGLLAKTNELASESKRSPSLR